MGNNDVSGKVRGKSNQGSVVQGHWVLTLIDEGEEWENLVQYRTDTNANANAKENETNSVSLPH